MPFFSLDMLDNGYCVSSKLHSTCKGSVVTISAGTQYFCLVSKATGGFYPKMKEATKITNFPSFNSRVCQQGSQRRLYDGM